MGTLESIKVKLIQQGYSGLYCDGECGCVVDDLAPCGECEQDDEGWINHCEPGHKHIDPRNGEFIISPRSTPPTPEEFDRAFANC